MKVSAREAREVRHAQSLANERDCPQTTKPATDRNAEHYRALLGLYAWGLDSGGLNLITGTS